MPTHVQIQFMGKGDEWHAAGDVQVMPDGRIKWSDNKFVFEEFIRSSMFHPDEGRELTITEPEKYFDAWLHFGGNRNFRIVDMDDPEMAAYVLPQADWPRVTASPESIPPFQEEVGVEEPTTEEEKARELAVKSSLLSESNDGKTAPTPAAISAQGNTTKQTSASGFDDDFTEPDGCFLIGLPDGTVIDPTGTVDLSTLNQSPPQPSEVTPIDVHPPRKAIAYQIAGETPSLGDWRTVSVWCVNPNGGMDQTGPDGLVHHDFGMDVFGCEMLLEAMLKSKCDAHHRWVEVVGEEKLEPNQQGSQPSTK